MQESRYCWITALKPKRGRSKSGPDLYVENPRRYIEESESDVDAYAYVQMAPPAHNPMMPPARPRAPLLEYQQLGAQNKLQPYVQIHGEGFKEQPAQDMPSNMYDSPKKQGPDRLLPINLQIYDNARLRNRLRGPSPFRDMAEEQQPAAAEKQHLLPPGGAGSGDRGGGERPSSVNIQDMDAEQLQLLISQLQSMGVLGQPTTQAEEHYSEDEPDDGTYERISDDEGHIYDDLSDPKPLYVNIDQVGEAKPEAIQAPMKKKPMPPPKVHWKNKPKSEGLGVQGIPKNRSVGECKILWPSLNTTLA